ncbi:MAG: NUDIX domain-containing protein [Oscillospiraceae bacterium]|jgi:predicted NUDIX family NTP pyrophosphohydrolase|nr:NUDIX domain-containing protein [Oscillospiraceae bacterium]
MAVHSAGVMLYRFNAGILEVLLVHPGGPFWARKDDGAWSIPKGLVEGSEDVLSAAKREFTEETGFAIDGDFLDLGSLTQPSKKIVTAFALHRDVDAAQAVSNTFTLEWPPKSGRIVSCPEIDRAEWFPLPKAREKIAKGQREFISRLAALLHISDKEEIVNYSAENAQLSLFD